MNLRDTASYNTLLQGQRPGPQNIFLTIQKKGEKEHWEYKTNYYILLHFNMFFFLKMYSHYVSI